MQARDGAPEAPGEVARYGAALIAACGVILTLAFLTSWRLLAGLITGGVLLLGSLLILAVPAVRRRDAVRLRWAGIGVLAGTGLVAAFVAAGLLAG